MVIYCGCRACEWYDRGKCSKAIGDMPACEVEPTLFDLDDMGVSE